MRTSQAPRRISPRAPKRMNYITGFRGGIRL